MAKNILWLFVIVGFMVAIYDHKNGTPIETYNRIVILSSLAVIAVCDAIERGNKA